MDRLEEAGVLEPRHMLAEEERYRSVLRDCYPRLLALPRVLPQLCVFLSFFPSGMAAAGSWAGIQLPGRLKMALRFT